MNSELRSCPLWHPALVSLAGEKPNAPRASKALGAMLTRGHCDTGSHREVVTTVDP